jgi:hypothetical protein
MHTSGGDLMATTTRKTYSFTLTLEGLDELTIEVGDAIYAVVDDGFLHSDGPAIYLDIDREAASLGDAIGSAIKDVERAGFAVTRIDVGDRRDGS